MTAITIDLPEDIETKVRAVSAAAGKSVSDWLAEAAQKQLDEALPPQELTQWFGAFPDLELPTRSEPWSKNDP